MIYKLGTDINPFEANPELLIIPEFKHLTPREMTFVCLVCDPKTPLRTLFGKERRNKAAILAGYPMEGNRLDKNGRNIRDGKLTDVEAAIEAFKELHYDERAKSRDALKKQIVEIREFLESDKTIPLISNGKIVLGQDGKEMFVTDQKALKLAAELSERIPKLISALEEVEVVMKKDQKFSGTTYTSADIEDDESEEGGVIDDAPLIEKIMNNSKTPNQ